VITGPPGANKVLGKHSNNLRHRIKKHRLSRSRD
jgi:hypothetical protein